MTFSEKQEINDVTGIFPRKRVIRLLLILGHVKVSRDHEIFTNIYSKLIFAKRLPVKFVNKVCQQSLSVKFVSEVCQ